MSDPVEAEPAFEAILTRLQDVVGELERGDLPLERSLTLFEEGVRLVREGGTRLDRAEARVEELLAANDAGIRTRPLDLSEPRKQEGVPSSTPSRTSQRESR
jgi:exodeoxyribonuclease VII small subunit